MGDRALIQLKCKQEVSPVLYMHWGGSYVGDIIKRTKARMASRHEIDYAFARLVQEAISDSPGDAGFGVWNQVELLTEGDSHDDAGCFVVDISSPEWPVTCFGGYGLADDEER
ncbi:hypothetical protein [Xanthomonas albilineans]|uniref:hypothetical protein n=1 Tax=Xanthomonas albilineans TaxID=29447 RepID=UPI0005F339EC|nr:hypothetical protein [Xanthomonas albilineans]